MILPHNQYSPHSILKPTLIEPTIFYRSSYRSRDERWKLELFEFCEGEFTFVRHVILPFKIHGVMLNGRFFVGIVREEDSWAHIIWDLDQERIVMRPSIDCTNIQYVSHDGVAYVIHGADRAVKTFMVDEGEEIPVHCVLQNYSVYAMDHTPGCTRFITAENDTLFSCRIDKNSELIRTPFNGNVEKGDIIARVLDVIVPQPTIRSRFPDVVCEHWNFVCIDDEVYCSEYDGATGVTNFYRMDKHDVQCMFMLDEYSTPLSEIRAASFRDFPVHLDMYNNSAALIHCSPDSCFEGHVFHSMCRFYSSDTKKWDIAFATETKHSCYIYNDDGSIAATIDKPLDDTYCAEISFCGNSGAIFIRNDDDETILVLNGSRITCKDRVKYLRIVGNYVWYMDGGHLVMHILNAAGEVVKTVEKWMGNIKRLVANPYCPQECCAQCYIVRYDEQDEDLKCYEFDYYRRSVNPCFIDTGILAYGNKVFEFDTSGIKKQRGVQLVNCYLQSPKPGVLVGYMNLKDFQVNKSILVFESSETELCVKTDTVSILEFLGDCDISTIFSSFAGFAV
ncbi:hypothetical protein PCE1_001668 [Barthelona sp. PCE]